MPDPLPADCPPSEGAHWHYLPRLRRMPYRQNLARCPNRYRDLHNPDEI